MRTRALSLLALALLIAWEFAADLRDGHAVGIVLGVGLLWACLEIARSLR